MRKLGALALVILCGLLISISQPVAALKTSLNHQQSTSLTPTPSSTVVPTATNVGRLIVMVPTVHDGFATLYQINTDGSGLVTFASGTIFSFPELSPDGKQFVYGLNSGDSKQHFMCIVPNTINSMFIRLRFGCPADAQKIETGDLDLNFPVWLPDGQHIAATDITSPAPNFSTYIVDIRDASVQAFRLPKNSGLPTWSPDGSRIAFTQFELSANRNLIGHLYVIATDGSNPIQVTSGDYNDELASWSPNGKQIAFGRYDPVQNGHILYLANSDGANLHLLGNTIIYGSFPSWSPDGRYLAFIGGQDQIYIIHPDGTGLASVPIDVDKPHGFGFVSWVPEKSF